MAIIKTLANAGEGTREADHKGTPTLPEGYTVGIIEKVETDDKEKFFFVTIKVTESKAANVPMNLLRPSFTTPSGTTPAETESPLPATPGKSYKKSVEIQATKVQNPSKADLPGNYKYDGMVAFLGGLFGLSIGQKFNISELADRACNEKQELRGRTVVINSNRFLTGNGRSKTNWSWEVLEESNEDVQANLKVLEVA